MSNGDATKKTRLDRHDSTDTTWPGRLGSDPAMTSRFSMWSGYALVLAEAADTPRRTAGSATAAATTAASATSATPAATAAVTASATAAAARDLHEVTDLFLVKKVERRQADVSDFFFTQRHRLRRRNVQFLRSINRRYRRCCSAPRQRKSQSSGTQRRHCGSHHTLALRSLLHP